jgi:hypothetical protein
MMTMRRSFGMFAGVTPVYDMFHSSRIRDGAHQPIVIAEERPNAV